MPAKKKSTTKKASKPVDIETLSLDKILNLFVPADPKEKVRIHLVGKAKSKKLIEAVRLATQVMGAILNQGTKYTWVNYKAQVDVAEEIVFKKSLYGPQTFKTHISTLRNFIWEASKLHSKYED